MVATPVLETGASCVGVRVPSSALMKQIIPLYTWYGDTQTWDRRISTINKGDLVILDPNNGPPPSNQIATIKSYVNRIRERGGFVFGYVHTSYGARPFHEIMEDITKWARISVDRIFFDEWYYTEAEYQYVVWLMTGAIQQNLQATNGLIAAGPVAIFNPGVPVKYNSVPARAVIVTYESIRSEFPTRKWKSWEAAICYSGSEPVVGPEYSYVTDDTLPNPLDGIQWADALTEWGQI